MIKKGDVLFIDLPAPIGGPGREQIGRRPSVAIQDESAQLPTIVIVPFTSQLGGLRFPFTFRVEPTSANGLTYPSVLLVFQLQVLDKRRVVNSIGQLEAGDLSQLDAEIRRMLKL